MNYPVYKEARRAAWSFLIENKVTALPLSFSSICQRSGISIYRDNSFIYLREGQHGAAFLRDGRYNILVSGSDSIEVQRMTIAHEIGHIYMRHPMKDSEFGRTFGICHEPVSPEEYQAERFAVNILAPACVLKAAGVLTAAGISELCRIPMKEAKRRADRMRTLIKRGRFLTDPLEAKVYEQFRSFAEACGPGGAEHG